MGRWLNGSGEWATTAANGSGSGRGRRGIRDPWHGNRIEAMTEKAATGVLGVLLQCSRRADIFSVDGVGRVASRLPASPPWIQKRRGNRRGRSRSKMQACALCTSMFRTSMVTMKISAPHALRRDARTIRMRSLVSQFTRGVSRREVVGVAALIFSNPALSLPLQEAKDSENIRYRKLESGVKIQDIIEGEGPEAHEGDLVEFNYVCRRSNGYFVHSTVDQFSGESSPVVLPLDGKQIIEGLKDVIVGMKAGGKRRALIPPNVGYINENLKPIPDEFGPRRSLLSHASEPLVFEVQLLKVL
ncbi:peptidyl-prolyl cis-trans isomerase FKBP16-1, chloroplastic-like isoform X2 [Zingiber officinale]|nr:peptidyl-prolyl cis-trans isomerase FKBP16-1, chloroplastic-like isoform X2 [Zingiber officinale]